MNYMTRREALGTLAAAGAAAWMRPGAAEAPVRKKPNIIFILADDLGYGDVGCYGQEQILTPRLDRMAAEGIKFTDAYAGSTVCAPARCSLMTGFHQGHAYIRGNRSDLTNDRVPLRPEDTTVAEVLREADYVTGLIGKWGLGEPDTTGIPNRQGFDEFFGYLNQNLAHNYYPETLWHNEEEVRIEGNVLSDEHNVCKQCEVYSHDLFTEKALDFIRRHEEEPFFLYLPYTIPHANNAAGRSDQREHGMEVPSEEPYCDKPWPGAQRSHAAMITRLDRDVGKILDLLEEKGMAENTLVIFSSDNGPHAEGGADPDFFNSGGPLRGIKRDLYEGGIRVPTIAWWPGVTPPGVVSDHAWAFWDFLPTAAELAGVESPACDGISIVPTLLGDAGNQPTHDHLYWEFRHRTFKQAVRFGDWKAVRNALDAPTELYNLVKDMGEAHDVADEHPEVVAQAERLFETSRTESRHWPAQ